MKNRKYFFALLLIPIFMISMNVISNNASAALNPDDILKKVLLRGLPKCYGDTYMRSKVDDVHDRSVELSDLFEKKGSKVTDDAVLVPSQNLGNTLNQDVPDVSCMQVFDGYSGSGGTIKGLFNLYGKSFNLSQMGYKEEKVFDATEECLYFNYTINRGATPSSGKSNGLCFTVDSEGKIIKNERGGLTPVGTPGGDSGSTNIDAQLSLGSNSTDSALTFALQFVDKKNEYKDTAPEREILKCTSLKINEIKDCLNKNAPNVSLQNNSGATLNFKPTFVAETGNASTAGSNWVKDSKGYGTFISYLTGGSSNTPPVFSEQEKFDVASYYVQKVIKENDNVAVDPDSCYDSKKDLKNDYGVMDAGKWCKVVGWEQVNEKFNVVSDSNDTRDQALKTVNFEGVLKQLMAIDESKLTDKSGIGIEQMVNEENEPSEVEPTCANTGGANSLGWIVCPLLDWMATASQSLYDDYVEPALQVSPKLFTENQDGGVRYAWGIFQGIANTLFIIMLLIVIFSQLTGVGIDNYGIKKIMPKLIVAAILINLSYLICLAAIDLSNILGNALQALFDSYQPHLNDVAINGKTVVNFGSAGMTLLTGVTILGGLAVGVWGAMSEDGLSAIVLVLLIGALTVVIAIFSLFLLLAVREAAIIVLVVASPLAFVCYMLPNTKSVFDKWYKFMKGLLLVYPICGLLVGGGNFVSKLLLSSGAAGQGFFSAFMAMVIGVAPIFLIPTVLKGSIAAMGKLGDGILRMGNNIRGGMRKTVGNIEKGVKGSERYKNNAAEFKRNKFLRGNQRTIDRLNNKRERNGGMLSDRDARMLARSQEAQDKARRENMAARTIMAEQDFKDKTEGDLHRAWNEAFDSGDVQQLDALTNVIMSRYGSGGAKFIGDSLASKHIAGAGSGRAHASMSALRDNLQHNNTFNQQMRNKASDAYEFINNGGKNSNGDYVDLSHYTRPNSNHISTSISDWATQSASTLQRALDGGALTIEQANEILNSTDPAIQSGIQSDPSKRDVLQAAVYNNRRNPSGIGPNLSNNEAAARYRSEVRDQQNALNEATERRNQQMAEDLSRLANQQNEIDRLNRELQRRDNDRMRDNWHDGQDW